MSSMFPNSDHTVDCDESNGEPSPAASTTSTRRFFENSDHNVAPAGQDAASVSLPASVASTAEGDSPSVEVPKNVQKLREGRMYDAQGMYREAIGRGTIHDKSGLDPNDPQVQAVDREVSNIMADFQLASTEAQQVVAAMNVAEVTDDMRAEAEQYVNSITPDDAALAVELLDRDPRVATILGDKMNHPVVVRTLVEKARTLRAEGKL